MWKRERLLKLVRVKAFDECWKIGLGFTSEEQQQNFNILNVGFCSSSSLIVCSVFTRVLSVIHELVYTIIAELWRPEGPPSGAPYPYGKQRETHELIFSWLSWLVLLLVVAYARRQPRSRATWRL